MFFIYKARNQSVTIFENMVKTHVYHMWLWFLKTFPQSVSVPGSTSTVSGAV